LNLPKITDALLMKDYSEQDIAKILGGKLLRVMHRLRRPVGADATRQSVEAAYNQSFQYRRVPCVSQSRCWSASD
jgi:hypothetical protein